MREHDLRPIAGLHLFVLTAVAIVAILAMVGPIAAQTEEHGLTSEEEMAGACCAGSNDLRHITEAECQALGETATWFLIRATAKPECGACAHATDLACHYTTESRCDDAEELFCPDTDCASCAQKAHEDDPPDSNCMMHRIFRNESGILADMGTYHRFQNEIVVESAKGREMKALFHEHMTELGMVLALHPDLLLRGKALLDIATPGFRDLLSEGDGEELVLDPDLVQTINEFLGDVAEHASPEAQAALEQVQAEFEAVGGKSLRQIRIENQR